MAAKKRGRDVWAERPKFDHATVISSAEVQEHAWRAFEFVARLSIVEELLRLLECERGEWLRLGHTWSKPAQLHSRRAFERAGCFFTMMHTYRGIVAGVEDDPTIEDMRARFWQCFGTMLDVVQPEFDPSRTMTETNALAGLSGPSPALQALRAMSAVSAIGTVCLCLRRAAMGLSMPFWPYLDDGAAKRARGKNGARAQPANPGELEADEVAILRICANASRPLLTKEVAAESGPSGKAWGESHASRRKKELMDWGLLKRDRHFALSDLGREWLTVAERSGGSA